MATVAPQGQATDKSCDFRLTAAAEQDAEGASYIAAYLARLRAGTAEPGELAVILAFVGGELLHGACRAIERALGLGVRP